MRQQIAVAIFSAMLAVAAHAAQGEVTEASEHDLNGRVLQEVYAGVIVDQTVTVVGHEFYQYFAALWRDKERSERYAISVHERPSARHGSQLWIEYAQRRVFQAFLPMTRANVKTVSQEAADIAFQNVVDIEVQRLVFRDPDLGADEM